MATVEIKEKVKQVIDRYGQDICEDQRRLESILSDFIVNDKKNFNLLVNACKAGICLKLYETAGGEVDEITRNQLVKKLVDEYAIMGDNAAWAVDTWIYAYGKSCSASFRPLTRQPEEDGNNGTPKGHANVTGVNIAYSNIVIHIGETEKVKLNNGLANRSTLKWHSDNSGIASVDQNGFVKGVSTGMAMITISDKTGTFLDSCPVNVLNIKTGANKQTAGPIKQAGYSQTASKASPGGNIVKIVLMTVSTSMFVRDKRQLEAVVTPSGTPVVWFSDTPDIVSVSNTGFIEALKEGRARITVSASGGAYKATCTINVIGPNKNIQSSYTGTNTSGNTSTQSTAPKTGSIAGVFFKSLFKGLILSCIIFWVLAFLEYRKIQVTCLFSYAVTQYYKAQNIYSMFAANGYSQLKAYYMAFGVLFNVFLVFISPTFFFFFAKGLIRLRRSRGNIPTNTYQSRSGSFFKKAFSAICLTVGLTVPVYVMGLSLFTGFVKDNAYYQVLNAPGAVVSSQEGTDDGGEAYVVINVGYAYVREGPALDSKDIGSYKQDTKLVYLNQSRQDEDGRVWYQVKTPEGKTGWISEKTVNAPINAQ